MSSAGRLVRSVVRGRGRERSAAFYDGRVPSSAVGPYWRSPYYYLWCVIADRLTPLDGRGVLDIGCGTAQLGELLTARGLRRYVGFDFSGARVMAARERTELDVRVADAYTTELLTDAEYDTVVCTEFLEHIDGDLEVLGRLRDGVRVIATVPSFPSDGHVRHFRDENEVIARYGGLIRDLSVSRWVHAGDQTLFLLDGVVRTSASPA